MKYPEINCYPFHANLLSVISNNDLYKEWFYNFYIQLVCPKNYQQRGMRIDYYTTLLWKSCPFIYYQRLSRDLVNVKWNSIIEFIIDCISLGYYVYFTINTYFVSNYDSFLNEHMIHDIFIFGYDTEKEIFKVADNFKNGKYAYEEATFKEIYEGYTNISLTNRTEWLDGIELINYRKKTNYFDEATHEYTFDMSLFKDSLQDYLNSINTVTRYRIPSEQWRSGGDWVYGLDIYDFIHNYFDDLLADKTFYDIRPFHVLWEHKKIMLNRLKYLKDSGYLSDLDSVYNKYSDIENDMLLIKSLWIKYSLIKEEDTIIKILKKLEEVKAKEQKILERLISMLP